MPRKTDGRELTAADGEVASMRPRPDAAENAVRAGWIRDVTPLQ